METITELLKNQFIWGLALGLLITFFVWKSGFSNARHLKKENKRIQQEADELQGHLNTQLKINATGNETLTNQLTELKEQNENLRVNISTIQQKPEKAEMKHLHITEVAVSRMREQAPGFATAWEQALRAAEEEYAEAEGGFSKLIKRFTTPRLSSTSEHKSENDSEPETKAIEVDEA